MTLLAEEYVEACLTHRELSALEHDDAVDHLTDMEAVLLPDAVTVAVTQRHIDRGACRAPAACAGALAASEALGLPVEIGSRMATVFAGALPDHQVTARYALPNEMRTWVARFDLRKDLAGPITFTMTRVL